MALTGKERADLANSLRGAGIKDTEVMSGTVVAGSVDTDLLTCSVEVLWHDEPIEGVLLNVIESNVGGCYVLPKDGSIVHLVSIDGPGMYQVVKTEEVKKLHLKVEDIVEVVTTEISVTADNSKLTGKKDEWAFNEGKNGGVPVSSKVAKRISDLETKFNNTLNALKGITITLAPSGAVPFAPFFSSITPVAPTTKASDIENKKVKH